MADVGEAMARFTEALDLIGAVADAETYAAMRATGTAQGIERDLGAAVEEAIAGCRLFVEHSQGEEEVLGRVLSVLDEAQRALQAGGLDDHVRRLSARVVEILRVG